MQQKLTLAILLLSYLSSIQATSFINDDFFAYPRYKLEFTDRKIPESSVFSQQQTKEKQIGWWNSQGKYDGDPNKVIMVSGNAQPFLCTIPDTSAHQNQHSSTQTKPGTPSIEEKQHTIERAIELLKPLENKCLYFPTHGYWTYEYCHMQHVRQFHLDSKKSDDGKIVMNEKTSFILGKHPPLDKTNNDDLASENTPKDDGSQQKTTLTSTTSLQQISNKQVLVYYWGDGTPCDITNQPRKIDIQFQCAAQDNDQIVFFEEVSTCHYRMSIATPRLCDDTMVESQAHPIACNPIVPEHLITDHEQQGDDNTMKSTIPIGEIADQERQTTQKQQQESDDDTTLTDTQKQSDNNDDNKDPTAAPLATMEKSDLVGMISDLSKQVEQLKKSIDQQSSMDQLLLQQSQVIYMDENGQLIWGGLGDSTGNNNNLQQQQQQQGSSNNDAIQTFIKQFLWGSSSSPASSQQLHQQPQQSQQQRQQQGPPVVDGSDTQQQNKKAYEKNYYSVD